jgi:steroid delta-isomerase-like uncharacterized protein
MSEQENKAIALRYYNEILNDADLAVIDELLDPEFIFTIPTHPEPFHGPSGFKDLVTMLHSAFPDLHLRVEHLLAQNDMVVGHWSGSGTHTGASLTTVVGDVKATGRPFTIEGITWLRMKGGRIIESLANEDTLGLLMQLGALPSPPASARSTTPEQNAAVVGRYFNELLSQGRTDVIEEILAPAFAFRIPTLPEPIRGPDGFRTFVTTLRTAFPDIVFTVERQIAEGDKVASRWTIQGTHRGEFLGVPASGRRVQDQGVDIFRIEGGRIAEVWVNENDFGLMQQIGGIPSADTKGDSQMSATSIKTTARQLFENAWNEGDFTLLEEVVDEKVVDHAPVPGLPPGREGMKALINMFRHALAGLHLTILDEIVEGDRVVHRWEMTGTHKEDLMGVHGTGRDARLTGITIARFDGDKLVERWAEVDMLGLLQQIGAIPLPGSA